MAHAQKPDFVFPLNGQVHLNRWGRQFSRLLAAKVWASAWVMLDTPRSEMTWEYWLPTPFVSFPFTSPPVRHRVPPGSERTLLTVKEQRNILHEVMKRKANWIGHILRRNCLLQRVIEGKVRGRIEVTGRRGRRSKNLLDDLKEMRGYSHLKEEALDRTMWTARFGRGFGPVVRQTTKWTNSTVC